MSDSLSGSGENVLNTGELINEYCGTNHMKYHCHELASLAELFQLKNKYEKVYIERERKLLNKKERLFKTKNITVWQYNAHEGDIPLD